MKMAGAALLVGYVSIQICALLAPCRRPILIATPLPQSLTWCTNDLSTQMNPARLSRFGRLAFWDATVAFLIEPA
jgi:hypothetical protein